MTIKLSDVSDMKIYKSDNHVRLRFQKNHLTDYRKSRLDILAKGNRMELTVEVDLGQSLYYRVKRLKWNEEKTCCDIYVNCLNKYNLQQIVELFKQEIIKRKTSNNLRLLTEEAPLPTIIL